MGKHGCSPPTLPQTLDRVVAGRAAAASIWLNGRLAGEVLPPSFRGSPSDPTAAQNHSRTPGPHPPAGRPLCVRAALLSPLGRLRIHAPE